MKNNFLILGVLALLQGCGIYSFTGASTAAETMQINMFYNNTELAPANLGADFTNKLKDYFQRNSSLNIVEENSELLIEGSIARYLPAPIAPVASGTTASNDAAALTRLTIDVRVSYTDNLVPTNSFKDRNFSFYTDFPNTQNLTDIQGELEEKIFDQIMIDIFNATLANW